MDNNYEKKLKASREWKKKNKEKCRLHSKTFYLRNKNKILEKYKEKIKCPICGTLITKNYLKRHQQTKICKRIYNMKNQILIDEAKEKLDITC